MAETTKACRDLGELLPEAQTACRLFLALCRAQGLAVFVTETYRSQERQDWLYAQGRTRTGPVVTWTRHSRHTLRRAFDLAVNPPKALYDAATLRQAGKLAQSLGLVWGGVWNPPDSAHIEVPEGWRAPESEQKEEPMETYYQTVEKVPEWGRPTLEKLLKAGAFADPEHLNLPLESLRVFVILDRLGKI